MNRQQRMMMAVAMVAIMLVVPVTCIAVVEDEEDEVEGIPPLWAMRAGWFIADHWQQIARIAAFCLGIPVGWGANELLKPVESVNEDQLRRDEAKALSDALVAGFPSIANACNNYANIWSLTSEHWIRQAELASSMYWQKGVAYSPYDTMTLSSTYYNSAMMLVNATNQINELMSTIAERVGAWNASDVSEYYGNGKMQLKVHIGDTKGNSSSVSFTDSDGFSVRLGSIVGWNNDRTVKEGRNAVYYVGGPVWTSADAVMEGANGKRFELKAGWNEMGDAVVDGWTGYNVYRLTPGVQYFGNFMYVLESDAADTQTGLFVSNGKDGMIVTCDGSKLYDGKTVYENGQTKTGYDALKVSVVPQNRSDTSTSDITALLVYYAQLNSTINSVIAKANQSGRVVWDVFDDAGEVSNYLTTLTVPDVYENVALTDAQKKIMLAISMNDLADYWTENGGKVKTSGYEMTMDSFTLYCHGDITRKAVNPDGSIEYKTYENVIYTPIFQRSATLTEGQNTVVDYCYVLIYGQGTLTSETKAIDFDTCEGIWLGADSKLGVDKIYYGGKQTSKVDLVCSEVEYIDSEKMDQLSQNIKPIVRDDKGDLAEIVRLILVLVGAGLLFYGASRSDWMMVGIGVVLIVVGVVFADQLSDMIYNVTHWGPKWPFRGRCRDKP